LGECRELAERYELSRRQWGARTELAGWAFADGLWDPALRTADELIAAADAGVRDYTDPQVLSLRAWIRLARGDATGADADSERAAELASASDAQAQSSAFCVRARVALEAGHREEAEERASELAAIGRVLLPTLRAAITTFADVAWVFRDLGRAEEFVRVLDSTPVEGPWKDAARAIVDGDLVAGAEIIERMGHGACAAYARLRAAETLSAGDGKRKRSSNSNAHSPSTDRRGPSVICRGAECCSTTYPAGRRVRALAVSPDDRSPVGEVATGRVIRAHLRLL
jgi:hypothetical protein